METGILCTTPLRRYLDSDTTLPKVRKAADE
jgi:hypothetical protein